MIINNYACRFLSFFIGGCVPFYRCLKLINSNCEEKQIQWLSFFMIYNFFLNPLFSVLNSITFFDEMFLLLLFVLVYDDAKHSYSVYTYFVKEKFISKMQIVEIIIKESSQCNIEHTMQKILRECGIKNPYEESTCEVVTKDICTNNTTVLECSDNCNQQPKDYIDISHSDYHHTSDEALPSKLEITQTIAQENKKLD